MPRPHCIRLARAARAQGLRCRRTTVRNVGHSAARRPAASIKYSKPFLRTRRPAENRHWGIGVQSECSPHVCPCLDVGREALDVDAVGDDIDSIGRGTQRHGSPGEVMAAGGDPPSTPKRRFGHPADHAVAFGDVRVRAMKADHQRQRGGRGCRDDTARYDPVPMHDGGAVTSSDASSGRPSSRDRERCRQKGAASERHICSQTGGITEDVKSRHGRVAEVVETDATFARRPVDGRVPRRHDVHSVAPRGDPAGDRFHEGADGVPPVSGIRGCYHHDRVWHATLVRRLIETVRRRTISSSAVQPQRGDLL